MQNNKSLRKPAFNDRVFKVLPAIISYSHYGIGKKYRQIRRYLNRNKSELKGGESKNKKQEVLSKNRTLGGDNESKEISGNIFGRTAFNGKCGMRASAEF
jgi:hypothetical protein